MELSHEDVLNILKLIDESNFAEMRLEMGDLRLHVRKHGEGASTILPAGASLELDRRGGVDSSGPAVSPSASSPSTVEPRPTVAAAAPPASEEQIPLGLIVVRAPMLGTFYRAPSPGARPFCEVGDLVGPDDTLCLIEVMKLFNSISAGAAGRVVRILVENGAMVEYNQPLILVDPSEVSEASEVS